MYILFDIKYFKSVIKTIITIIECPLGTYGPDCLHKCTGKCLDAVACNRTTGKCDTGCDIGYTGELCETGSVKFLLDYIYF